MNMSFIQRNFQEIENYFVSNENKKRRLDNNHESESVQNLKLCKIAQCDEENNRRYIARMEKRNERERKRVQLVNKEFDILRELITNSDFFKSKLETNFSFDFSNLNRIDMETNLIYTDLNSSNKENIYPLGDCDVNNSHKKISKLKTLKLTIDYINYLSDILINDQSSVELNREHQNCESTCNISIFDNIMVCIILLFKIILS
jgi:hypothetical protein